MKKWKKLLIPAMCVFMLQTPVIANAQTGTNDAVTSTIKDPAATPAPTVKKNGIYTEKGKKYYYVNGVKKKNCWDKSKKYYFGKNGAAYAAPKAYDCKKNVVVKKIGKKYYGFDRNGCKVKKGVYADTKGTPYYFDKNGVRVTNKSTQLKKASKYMANAKNLRKLLGKPSRTKTASSCMPGVKKDLTLTYANITVQLGRKSNGSEIVYGIQAR
ncbi:MAG: hypothetical protein PUE78_02055 [Clostridia bacterium]|nr:hypothetical protein [Clostridia bacterium]